MSRNMIILYVSVDLKIFNLVPTFCYFISI